jgi:hypothetical protein
MAEHERPFMAAIGLRYKRTHTWLLDLVDDMTDAELCWQPHLPGNSVAWMLWHLGRFADGFQTEIAHAHEELTARLGNVEQVWFAEGIAARWGLDAARLGPTESGKGMPPADALSLRLPDREALLDYVGRCFALADRAVDVVDDRHFLLPFASRFERGPVAIGKTILANLQHERYHLGQVRYLKSMMRRKD